MSALSVGQYDLYIMVQRFQPTSRTLFHLLVFSLALIVDLLFYVHGKHLMSCRDGQLT